MCNKIAARLCRSCIDRFHETAKTTTSFLLHSTLHHVNGSWVLLKNENLMNATSCLQFTAVTQTHHHTHISRSFIGAANGQQ